MPNIRVARPPRRRWSPEETRAFVEFYPLHGGVMTAAKFGRTLRAVWDKAEELGLRPRGAADAWTTVEVALLRREYPANGAKIVAMAIGRTPVAVRLKASRLGLKRSPRRSATRGKVASRSTVVPRQKVPAPA